MGAAFSVPAMALISAVLLEIHHFLGLFIAIFLPRLYKTVTTSAMMMMRANDPNTANRQMKDILISQDPETYRFY